MNIFLLAWIIIQYLRRLFNSISKYLFHQVVCQHFTVNFSLANLNGRNEYNDSWLEQYILVLWMQIANAWRTTIPMPLKISKMNIIISNFPYHTEGGNDVKNDGIQSFIKNENCISPNPPLKMIWYIHMDLICQFWCFHKPWKRLFQMESSSKPTTAATWSSLLPIA